MITTTRNHRCGDLPAFLMPLGTLFFLLCLQLQAGQCLWRVKGKDGNVFYLFGSIHFAKPEIYPLPDPVMAALAAADTVVFETDLRTMLTADNTLKQAQASYYDGAESLAEHINTKTMAELDKVTAEFGFTSNYFANFRPWHCANTLAMIALKKAGFDPAIGIDRHILEKAALADKLIVGLEEPDFLFGLFAKMTDQEAEDYLRQALSELAEIATFAPILLTAWQAGDSARLSTLVLDGLKASPFLYQRLFLDRNRAWLPKLRELASHGKKLFVTVGAGHLVGPDSLVKMLQDDGFEVEQL